MQAEALLDRMASIVGRNLPPGVTPVYFDGFLRRNRRQLVAILDQQLRARRGGRPAAAPPVRSQRSRPAPWPQSRPSTIVAAPDVPDLWSASKRTAANLAAMRLAASKRPEEMSAADRAALAAYSGWGGLSIQAVAHQFPTGFPVSEPRGLIYEFYTPTKVVRKVARVIQPLVPSSDAQAAARPGAGGRAGPTG